MATSNQLEARRLREQERSNRENERIKDKDADTRKHQANTERGKVIADKVLSVVNPVSWVKALNDPTWYNQDGQLVKDVASLSYNNPLGNAFNDITKRASRAIPGILVLEYIHTLGLNGQFDPEANVANIAAKNIYAYVRYANSGARNYESTDLLLYLLAMDEVNAYYAALCRIYSAAMTAKGHNRYWVDAMLRALGVDPSDVRSNLANFRAYINSFAVRANSFYVPNVMPLFKRHFWMNSHFFKDSSVKKSQDYVFLQRSFGLYDDTEGALRYGHKLPGTTSELCPQFKPNAGIKVQQLMDLGNAMLNILANSEDIGIMSGDILKAYGEGNMVYLPSIDKDFHIESEYVPEVLSQITNAICVGEILTPGKDVNNDNRQTGYDIEQTATGSLYQGGKLQFVSGTSPVFNGVSEAHGILVRMNASSNGTPTSDSQYGTFPYSFDNYLINMYKDDVTPDENMVASRLMVGVAAVAENVDTPATSGFMITACGSEMITHVHIVTLINGGVDLTGFSGIIQDYVPADLAIALQDVGHLAKFDWSPNFYIASSSSSTEPQPIITPISDTRDAANYASIDRTVLNNLHYVAVMSEYSIPMLGLKVRTR